jgi:vacuolar-type H+-ATPase subunit I/STV1
VKARANTALKVFAGPDISKAEFMKACADAASDARDKDLAKQTTPLDRQIKTLGDKLTREERELQMDQNELAGRKREEGSNLLEIGASVLGVGRRKSVTSQFAKNRLTSKAKADVEESIEAIAQYKQQIADLQKQREDLVAAVNSKWGDVVNDITEITVNPKKTDVFVKIFGVAWMPYYSVQAGGAVIELPAFGAQ